VKKNSLKIAQVIASKGWGGREKVPLLFAEEYRRLGHEAVLWTNPDTSLGQETVRQGFPLYPYRFRSYLNPSGFLDTTRALLKFKPDVIHVHHSRDLWFLVPILRMLQWKGPLLLSKHVESRVQKKDPLHRFLYDRVDEVLGCSTMIRENVIETCPVDPQRVAVGYAPVDTQRFQFQAAKRRKIRAAWRMEKNIIIGMVARLTPGKGQELLLKTAALMARKNPKLRFKVAGQTAPDEKNYAEGLFRLKKELGLEGLFDYEGYVSDIPGFLSAVDIAVHGAPAESFGLAIVEAMACGRPVIARAGGGVGDILDAAVLRSRGGILMESDHPADWAKPLLALARAPEGLARIANANRKSALRFSLRTLSQLNLNFYWKLLADKTRKF
jgi:glycosyltransferase involved in cell wall biosynthesis